MCTKSFELVDKHAQMPEKEWIQYHRGKSILRVLCLN